MAKLRLNKEMREALVAFAEANAVSPTYDKKADKAYATAIPLVLAAVTKKYPVADMAVLERYDLAKPDKCLIGYSDAGQQLTFNCREADAPVVPKGYSHSRNYAWPAKTVAAIEEHNLLTAQARDERAKIVRDYRTLVASYQTAEDVLDVWPAAQVCLQGFMNAANRNLPASLPVEAIERIRSMNLGSALAA